MKNTSLLNFRNLLLILLFLSVSAVKSQTIQINQEFNKDSVIYPFEGIDKAYSFKISGTVILKSDTSMVRVILEDIYRNGHVLASRSNNYYTFILSTKRGFFWEKVQSFGI